MCEKTGQIFRDLQSLMELAQLSLLLVFVYFRLRKDAPARQGKVPTGLLP